MKRYVVLREDGGVTVIIPSNKKEISKEKIERDIKNTKGYKEHHEIDELDIPKDRYFRDAWCFDCKSKKVTPEMEKSKSIHLNKLRNKRTPILNNLDKELLKSIEINDEEKKNDIVRKKNELRDFPQNLDLSKIKDIDELKNTIPDCLKEN